MAWFPQALLYGFWQSHLGKKRQNTRHARAWVSEIVGWQPAATQTKVLGLKGDALNLNTDDIVTSNPDDRTAWEIGKGARIAGAKSERLSRDRSRAGRHRGSRCPASGGLLRARDAARNGILCPAPARQPGGRVRRGRRGRTGIAGGARAARPPARFRQGIRPAFRRRASTPVDHRDVAWREGRTRQSISAAPKQRWHFSMRPGNMPHPGRCHSTVGELPRRV